MTLPDNGSDEAFVALAFTPDGTSVLASYPDSPTSMSQTTWLLPVDGSPGTRVGRGQFTLHRHPATGALTSACDGRAVPIRKGGRPPRRRTLPRR